MRLQVYTDGACSGNPGPGGWACLYLFPEEVQLLSGGAEKTTNNRMELMAVLKALEQFIERYCWKYSFESVEICSDSAYIVNSINMGYLLAWKNNHWCTKGSNYNRKTGAVKNYDLWRQVLKHMQTLEWMGVEYIFTKVDGHSGLECNEIVDKAARGEAQRFKQKKGKGD